MTLAALSTLGRDIHWDIDRLSGYYNFCNKLWNVGNFVIAHTINQDCGFNTIQEKRLFSLSDRWIISELNQTIKKISLALQDYRFDKIVNILYDFVWHQFCDWYRIDKTYFIP